MKDNLSKEEAEQYLRSLPFVEYEDGERERVLSNVLEIEATKAKKENRSILLSDIQKKIKPFVSSLDPEKKHQDVKKETTKIDGYQPPTPQQKLEMVQKKIDKLLASPKYSMYVERSLNSLRDQEKALKRTIR